MDFHKSCTLLVDVIIGTNILDSAINTAIELLQEDPDLSKEENLPIKTAFIKMSKYSKIWTNIS